MNTFVRLSAAIATSLLFIAPSFAQIHCSDRIVYRLVYDEEEVTRYRVEYRTEYRDREYTVRRPVWTTETRTRTVRVAKPVTETSERTERYTVLRPVWNTRYEERTVERTEWVEETSSRVRRERVLKPVDYVEEREQRRVVQRPVTETLMQPYQYTQMRPITTMSTQYVDQGGFVDQQVYHPGTIRHRLRWAGGGYGVDARTGQSVYYRRGFHWVPTTTPGRVETRRHYVPNVVGVQVPTTTLRPETVTVERPVQVTRMEQYEETRKVPVTVRRYEEEVRETEVPVTVRKPIIRRITYRIPVRTKEWEREVVERKIPVVTRKYIYEDKDESYDVRVCNMVEEVRTEKIPVTVRKLVPYTVVRRVPRRVAVRYPSDPVPKSSVRDEIPEDAEIIKEETLGEGAEAGKASGEAASEKPMISDAERTELELKKPENSPSGDGEGAESKEPEKQTPEANGSPEGEGQAPASELKDGDSSRVRYVGWRSLWE